MKVIKEIIHNIARFVATSIAFATLTLGAWYVLFRLFVYITAPEEIFNEVLKQMLVY